VHLGVLRFSARLIALSENAVHFLMFPGPFSSDDPVGGALGSTISEVNSVATRKHLLAVNRAIRASNLDELGLDAPLAELLRDLARLMDRAGEDGPSSKLLSAYLSATKDLRRATSPRSARSRAATAATEAGDDPESPAPLKLVEESPLDKIRRNKNRAAG